MAKFAIPYMMRDLVSQLEEIFECKLGIPMNGELPPSTEQESVGKAKFYFEGGWYFYAEVSTYRNHFGQVNHFNSIVATLRFSFRYEGEDPRIQVRLEDRSILALEMASSRRRSGEPAFSYEDPTNPGRVEAKRLGIEW